MTERTYTQTEVNALLNNLKRAFDAAREPLMKRVDEGGWGALKDEEYGITQGLMKAMGIASDFQHLLTIEPESIIQPPPDAWEVESGKALADELIAACQQSKN